MRPHAGSENDLQSCKPLSLDSFPKEARQSNDLLGLVPMLVWFSPKKMQSTGYCSLRLPQLVQALMETPLFFSMKIFMNPKLFPRYWPNFLYFFSQTLIMHSLYCFGILPAFSILNNVFGTYILLNKPWRKMLDNRCGRFSGIYWDQVPQEKPWDKYNYPRNIS